MKVRRDLLENFDGFIFDFDGTIIDSMKVHLKAWKKTFERYGKKMSNKEVGEVMYGINPEIVTRVFGDGLREGEVSKISNEKEELFRSQFDPVEDIIKGVIDFLNALKNEHVPMVVGSAAPPENMDYFMDRLGVRHYFKGIVHEEHVEKGKPSPEVFIKAAGLLHLSNEKCVVFEDSPTGAEAASKAGSKCIAVLTTKSKSDFDGIPDIIEYMKDYRDLLEK